MENNNRNIKEELYVTRHYKYANWLLTITAQFIEKIAEDHAISIFQSGFGFMNNDIPFTMLIHHTKKFFTGRTVCENDYTILFWVNDWGDFRIQDDHFLPSGEWELNCPSDREAIPDWEELTPLQIMTKKPIIGLSASESCDTSALLFNKIYKLLYDKYFDENGHYASDYLECHVACIYMED